MLTTGLTIECADESFFLSKITWSQFAYFRLIITSEQDVQVQAHEDFLPFLKFIVGRLTTLNDDHILSVHKIALDLGIDMDGLIAGQLTIRLHRWATSYAVGRECHSLLEIACNKTFGGLSTWPLQGDPFRTSTSIRNALLAAVLPIDGHPVIDMRNIHVVQKVWSEEINNQRATVVREHLQNAFNADVAAAM